MDLYRGIYFIMTIRNVQTRAEHEERNTHTHTFLFFNTPVMEN